MKDKREQVKEIHVPGERSRREFSKEEGKLSSRKRPRASRGPAESLPLKKADSPITLH